MFASRRPHLDLVPLLDKSCCSSRFLDDSIVTAVGMTPHLPIMVVAVIVAVILMAIAETPLSNFINAHPTIVMWRWHSF